MKKTRIMIVDDQRLFAESLKTVIETVDPALEVVCLAGDGDEALALADEFLPELVLMDVRMPKRDGVETTRILHFRRPEIKIIMLTTFEDEDYVRSALKFGASGYLLKNISPLELVASVRAAISGAVAIDPRVLSSLIQDTPPAAKAEHAVKGGKEGGRWLDELNRKERQILALMIEGFGNREIASRLYIAEQTVRNYVSRIYEKLGVTDRVNAVRKARDSGLF